MNGEQYILSFDLSEINRQIAALQATYTSFTESFQKSAEISKDQLRTIQSSVKEISDSLDSSFTKMDMFYRNLYRNLESTTDYFEKLEQYSNSFAENLKKVQGMDFKSLRSGAPDDTAEERISAIAPQSEKRFSMTMSISAETDELAEAALKKAEGAIKAAQKALKEVEESESRIMSTMKKITDKVKKELSSGKDAAMGIARKGTMGVVGGGLLVGLISAMVLGVQESQRRGAERGEMLNVFEAIGDMFEQNSKKAIGWFARFAEKAQFYFGIGRKEVQGVVKQMVDAGYKSGDIVDDFGKKITDVEANVATLSIGLDKHLNQATGTSMQNVIKLVTHYGDTLDTASDKYKRLAFEAQRSGMGVNKFIESVMSGSSALTQYGIEMEDVVEVMRKMQGYYESMGLKKQFAGEQAATAVKGISSGLANLDEGTMAALAIRMFRSVGALDALQQFKEGAVRVAKGENQGFLITAAKELRQMAAELTGGDRATGIRFLEFSGLNNQQATALFDVAEKLDQGVEIDGLRNEESKALRKAFVTEGQQLTELQKTQRSLIYGLADMGRGLLKVLTGILGTIAVGIKSIPQEIAAAIMMTKDTKRGLAMFEEIEQKIKEQADLVSSGADDIARGATRAGNAVGNQFSDIVGAIKSAAGFDPGGHFTRLGEALDEMGSTVDKLVESERARDLLWEQMNARINELVDKYIAVPLDLRTQDQADQYKKSFDNWAARQHELISKEPPPIKTVDISKKPSRSGSVKVEGKISASHTKKSMSNIELGISK